jgi:hypothetical protein
MKPVTKYFVRILLLNLLLLALLFIPVFWGSGDVLFTLLVFGGAQLVQLTVGLLMLINSRTKELGKGILLCVGVIFLVGLSVCSALLSVYSSAPH